MKHVIVGAGEAGLRAAVVLRDAGEKDIVLLNGETVPSYERPALSKPGDDGSHHRPLTADLSGIQVRSGVQVAGIDREGRRITLEDGTSLPYDRLLLATGAKPRRLPLPHNGRVLELRTIDDAARIYQRAELGRRAVIIGAGLIGLEMAAELVRRGLDVTVVEAGKRALGRAVPSPLAARIVERHLQAGVKFLFGKVITQVAEDGLELSDGTVIAADLILAAIGVEPDSALASNAGLECANGIVTDALLTTSDGNIFAAGDCANVNHPMYGPVRFETWRNAVDQGTLAAKSMLGMSEPLSAPPWFWSDQYELTLQVCGLPDEDVTVVSRPMTDGSLILFYMTSEGTLAAAAGLGVGNAVARDIRMAEMLIAGHAKPDPSMLADPAVKLKSMLRS